MYRLGFINVLTRYRCSFLQINRNYEHHNQIKNVTNKLLQTGYITSKSHERKYTTDVEYLVKIKNDPDTFGPADREQPTDEGDIKEEQYLEYKPPPGQKLRTKQYADIIKDLLSKRMIKEAIDVLEVRMIKEDRVKPENYIFNLILGACGRVGYTKKAFSLYNKMKQRNLVVTGGTYTALFNACANSPWAEDGLTRARHLREIMIEKRYEANDSNYNAMIKAFGRCGDLATAFSLVDEMAQKKIQIKDDTLNFLLQACISDKEAGFRHSLLVWRQFIRRKVNPSIYTYNLLLKAIRECGLGSLEITEDVIKQILQENDFNIKFLENKDLNNHNKVNVPEEVNINKNNCVMTSSINDINDNLPEVIPPTLQNSCSEIRPNLLGSHPHLGTILSLSEITKPEYRLLLVGGLSGFLKDMTYNKCTPNIKTFTQLLDCIPGTYAGERELINEMKKLKVKPDIDFYNMLIKKRSMRSDYDLAKEVLDLMKNSNMRPNLITYGVLALGCKTKDDAESLMNEMKNSKYRMNPEILGAMLHQACYRYSFMYVLEIMEICIREKIQPNQKFMERLEEFKKSCKKISNDKESSFSKGKYFQKHFKIFKLRYNTWKEEVNPITDDEVHPWQQFRQESMTNAKHYKDKSASSRFKPRHTSLYRKKQSVMFKNKSKGEKMKYGKSKQLKD